MVGSGSQDDVDGMQTNPLILGASKIKDDRQVASPAFVIVLLHLFFFNISNCVLVNTVFVSDRTCLQDLPLLSSPSLWQQKRQGP